MKRLFRVFLGMIFLLILAGDICAADGQSYRQISQDEAKTMMEKEDGYIVVDVRRQDEFEAGHIPGAICIPNESIGTEQPEELPDLNQLILIYCRSGNRSKQAAEKLLDMGYTNIYEFGGIIDWTGEIVTGSAAEEISEENDIWTETDMPVQVHYDRMWEYCTYADSTDQEMIREILDAIQTLEIGDEEHMVVDDYTDVLTFTFKDGSTKRIEFEGHCWVTEGQIRYQVKGISVLRGILDTMSFTP